MQSKLPLAGDGVLIVKIPKKSPGSLASISGTIKFKGNKRPNSINISAYSPNGGRGHVTLMDNMLEKMDSFTIDSLEPGL